MGYYGIDDPEPAPTPDSASWWRVLAWPIWGLLALVVVFVAVAVAPLKTRINFGGILGWLLGRNSKAVPSVAVSNSPPPRRLFPLGAPDQIGWVQAPVKPITPPWNPLARKDVVQLPSGQKIQLPQGIQRTDIEDVVHVTPLEAVVRLKPTAPVAATIAGYLTPRELLAKLEKIRSSKAPSGQRVPPLR